jgi:hypothetical protein
MALGDRGRAAGGGGIGVIKTWSLAVLALLLGVTSARAASWHDVFAADSDTVVFLGAHGELWKAPFHLATRETLWTPREGEHLARVRVSPDGRGVAWVTRGTEADTTRLWVAADGRVRDPIRYFSLQPSRFDRLHVETAMPTIEDSDIHGARFLKPNALTRRVSSTTVEWTPDSRAVVFGFDDGIAAAPVDSGKAFEVSRALAVELHLLDPAPIYLVDAVVLRGREQIDTPAASGQSGGQEAPPRPGAIRRGARAEQGSYLLYPLPHRWRVFDAGGFNSSKPWAASEGTVWWADGRSIRAIRTSDPRPTEEAHSSFSVPWLGFLSVTRELAWASGHDLHVRPESGGRDTTVATLPGSIKAVLRSATGDQLGLVGEQRMTLWDPIGRHALTVDLGGRNVTGLFVAPGGALFVTLAGARDHIAQLARVNAGTGALEPVTTPPIKGGLFAAASGGARILLFDPGPQAPATLHVYDVASGTWTDVENPGLSGWEPLAPR